MELLSRVLLHEIEAYESAHTSGPTVREVAADLGVPPVAHHELVERLERQIVLGHIALSGRRFQLTTAGRKALAHDAPRSAPPPVLRY
jgi:hypothetical protein